MVICYTPPPVLPGAGQGRPDPPPRAGAAHRPLPVGGGAGLRGGGGDGEVQGRPAQVLQEPRRALHLLREELPQPAPPATGRQTGGGGREGWGSYRKGLRVDGWVCWQVCRGVLVLLHTRHENVMNNCAGVTIKMTMNEIYIFFLIDIIFSESR